MVDGKRSSKMNAGEFLEVPLVKQVVIKAFFCRNTLCIARKNDEITARFLRQLPQAYCAG